MPAELKEALENAAKLSNRSLTAEIVSRLQASLSAPPRVLFRRDLNDLATLDVTSTVGGTSHSNVSRQTGPHPDWLTPEHMRSFTPEEKKEILDQAVVAFVNTINSVGLAAKKRRKRSNNDEPDAADPERSDQ